jgi:hypothetical protein
MYAWFTITCVTICMNEPTRGLEVACIVIFFKMDKRSTGFYGAHYTWTAFGYHPLYGGDIALRKSIWRR